MRLILLKMNPAVAVAKNVSEILEGVQGKSKFTIGT
jgi:hypothetical protein